MLLECTNVSKSYGGVLALNRVHLGLQESELLGLVGPNGAGKTTLIDVLGGEQEPDGGSIEMDGKPLKGKPSARAKQHLARTFQHPQVALELTARENIVAGLGASRFPAVGGILAETARGIVKPWMSENAEIDHICAGLGLVGIDRSCPELSFGEIRLVEMARALMQHPKVILLDEPFAGVDEKGVVGIIAAIEEVLRRGCGVLVVDHNVDIVASIVHRLALMDKGEIIFDGSPQECLKNPLMQSVYFGERESAL